MSQAPAANIDLKLKTTEFKNGVRETKRGFQEMGQSGKQSFQGMKPAIDSTTTSMNKLGMQTKVTSVNMQSLALGMAAAGASAIAMTASIQQLSKMEADLVVKRRDVEKRNLDIFRAEVALAKGRENGATSAADLAILEEDLRIKRGELTDTTKQLELAEKDMQVAQMQLAASAATTVLSSVFTLKVALAGLSKATFTQILASKALTVTTYTQSGAMMVAGRASIFSARGMRLLTVASWQFIKTPLGIALAAAAAAFLAFETNLLGARDALSSIVGFEIPSLFESMGNMMDATFGANEALEEQNQELLSLEKTGLEAAGAVDTLTGSQQQMAGVTESVSLVLEMEIKFMQQLAKEAENAGKSTAAFTHEIEQLERALGVKKKADGSGGVGELLTGGSRIGSSGLASAGKSSVSNSINDLTKLVQTLNRFYTSFNNQAADPFADIFSFAAGDGLGIFSDPRKLLELRAQTDPRAALQLALLEASLGDTANGRNISGSLSTSIGLPVGASHSADSSIAGLGGRLGRRGTGRASPFMQDPSRLGLSGGGARGRSGGHSRFRFDRSGGRSFYFLNQAENKANDRGDVERLRFLQTLGLGTAFHRGFSGFVAAGRGGRFQDERYITAVKAKLDEFERMRTYRPLGGEAQAYEYSAKLGISVGDLLVQANTPNGIVDIQNMVAFVDREVLAATTA